MQEEVLAFRGRHDLEWEASLPLNIGCEGFWPRERAGGGGNVPEELGLQMEVLSRPGHLWRRTELGGKAPPCPSWSGLAASVRALEPGLSG